MCRVPPRDSSSDAGTRDPVLPATAGTLAPMVRGVPGASIILGRFAPLLLMRPHVHERTCVTVVVDGSFVERVGGRERFCAPGTILSKPGLERHDDHMARTGSRQIIVEPDEREAELLAPCQALFNGISHFRDAAAVGLGRRLALEIEQPDEVTPLALAALAFEVLTLGTRRFQRARVLAAHPHGSSVPMTSS